MGFDKRIGWEGEAHTGQEAVFSGRGKVKVSNVNRPTRGAQAIELRPPSIHPPRVLWRWSVVGRGLGTQGVGGAIG